MSWGDTFKGLLDSVRLGSGGLDAQGNDITNVGAIDGTSLQYEQVGGDGTPVTLTDSLDLAGNALTDSTRDYLDLTGGNIRVGSGNSIEDGSGTERIEMDSSFTSLNDDTGLRRFVADDGNGVHIDATSDTPVQIADDEGGFTAIQYTTSASAPGTLELTDALVSHTVSVSETSDSMTADPETATEDGYITVQINGTDYQIPAYAP